MVYFCTPEAGQYFNLNPAVENYRRRGMLRAELWSYKKISKAFEASRQTYGTPRLQHGTTLKGLPLWTPPHWPG